VTGAPWQQGLLKAPRNHLVCPPDSRLVGVPRADGCHPFGTDGSAAAAEVVEQLSVIASVPDPVEVAVQLVRPQRFTELTGVVPEPIDPQSAYQGWRLP